MIYLGKNGVDRIRRLVSTDAWARGVADEISRRSRRLHDEPPVAWAYEPGRKVILPVSRALAERVHIFAMAWMLDGDPKHRQRLLTELEAAAEFPDWNPTHFLDTAEMMAGVALGRDWLEGLMTVRQRDRIDDAITRHGLMPALTALREPAFWTDTTHNWNIVCCGGAIVAAVAMRSARPAICGEVIALASEAMMNGLSAYAPDGGYPEGPSYWEYATRYAVFAIAALEEAGLDERRLADLPGLTATWRFGMHMTGPSELQFDYGDNLHGPDRSPVIGWLAMKSGDAAAVDWQERAPGPRHPFDLIWRQPAASRPRAAEPAALFVKAGVAALRDVDGGFYVAVKGGENSLNHAHLDLGTFVLEAGGERFVSDLGRDDYALPGYFSADRRFGYVRTGTGAHNTIVFGGRNQAVSARALCLGLRTEPGFHAAAVAIDDPDAPCPFRRAVALAPGCGIIIIDHIQPGQGTLAVTADWRIHTKAEVACDGAEATLRLGDSELKMRLIADFPASFETESVPTPAGQADNSDFTRVFARFAAATEEIRLAVVFGPTSADIRTLTRQLDALHDWLACAKEECRGSARRTSHV